MKKFHNPYNFVPAPRRKERHETLGDRQPVGHDSYKPGCWSGRISVILTTDTPLLALDAAGATRDFPVPGHHIFSTRLGADGLPYLPATSIKGMLRSTYEAVTNSRLSQLEKHDQQLAYRSPASDGLRMVPARVVGDRIELFFGTNNPTTQVFDNGGPKKTNRSDEHDQSRRNSVMHAAWIERHPDLGDLSLMHLKRVWAYITLWRHERPDFDFWNVVELRDEDDPNPRTPLAEQRDNFGKSFMLEPADPSTTLSAYPGYQPGRWVQGYVCVTGKNIDRKHDERLFFGNPVALSPSSAQMQALRAGWRLLIEDYERTFRENGLVDPDIEASRHILNAEQEKGVPDGTLCYAGVQGNGNGSWQVRGLFPVMISRRMHELSPIELLPKNLHPATRLFEGSSRPSEMSPADRVFGWVGQQGEGAYRGQLRLGVAKCLRDDAIQEFRAANEETTSVPLAILSQPKPQQVRFYVAKSDAGTAVANGAEDRGAIGYKSSNGLRGRKFYPHHANLPTEHWTGPQDERTQAHNGGHFQEYRRPNKFHPNAAGEAHQDGNKPYWKLTNEPTRDDQNRSIKNWIKPQTKFSFAIDVTNLSRVELGALIWLLDLDKNESAQPEGPRSFFHRLGGGKPLGFGSVKLAIDWEKTRLRNGEQWRDYYLSLNETFDPPLNDVPETLQACIVDFKAAVTAAYGESSKGFSKVPFIEAFLRGAEGFTDGYPIHYPRTRPKYWLDENDPVPPHPEGKSYEWFVANERTGRDGGDKLALPDLATDGGLKIYRSRD